MHCCGCITVEALHVCVFGMAAFRGMLQMHSDAAAADKERSAADDLERHRKLVWADVGGTVFADGRNERERRWPVRTRLVPVVAHRTVDESLVNGIARMAPFDVAAKQGLLEAGSIENRAELIIQLMQFFGRHDGEESVTLQ